MTTIMKMPASYVEVSKDEMEYDGGFGWMPFCFIGSLVCTAVGTVGVEIMRNCGVDEDTLRAVSIVSGVVGTALGMASGVGLLASAARGAAVTVKGAVGFAAGKQLTGAGWCHTIATWN